MCDICYIMEFLALGVHFATKQDAGYGTSTACYLENNNTIYVTAQSLNQSMVALASLPSEKAVEDQRVKLAGWLHGGQKMGGSSQHELKASILPSRHAAPDRFSVKKAASGEALDLALAWAKACWAVGMRLSEGKPAGNAIFGRDGYIEMSRTFWMRNPRVKFVTDADIFAHGVAAEQGFHGESRLLRYLVVKFLRKDLAGPLMLARTLDDLEEAFRNICGGKVFIGSNRPACADCSEFMERIGVDFMTKNATSSKSGHEWVHPFSLNARRGEVDVKLLAKEQADQKARLVGVAAEPSEKKLKR